MRQLISKEKVISQYLKLLNIPISRNYCEKLIASHPHNNTLLSIYDTLKHIGIPCNIFHSKNKRLENIPFPYVLHLNTNGGELVIIKDEKDLGKKMPFLVDWDGIVLMAKFIPSVKSQENQTYLSKERESKTSLAIFVISLLLLLLVQFFQNPSWIYSTILITTILGTFVGIILIAQELGIRYKLIVSFCNTGGMRTSCDQVMGSEEAKIIGSMSLSDATLSYFSFQLILIGILIPIHENSQVILGFLFILSNFSLLIVIYSLYVQYFKLKYWCKLCLLVDGILVLQNVLFFSIYTKGMIMMDYHNYLIIGFSLFLFIAISSLVHLLKMRMADAKKATQDEINVKRIKNNASVFIWLLLQEKQIDISPFEQEVRIGNHDSPIKILMASSFDCSHCKINFQNFLHLNELYPNQLDLIFRFRPTTMNDEKESEMTFLSYWLHNIHGSNNESDRTVELIKDRFTLRPDEFSKKYIIDYTNINLELVNSLLIKQFKWFNKFEITQTPTFLFQGYELPTVYRINDLDRMIPDLEDFFNKEKGKLFDQLAYVTRESY